MVGDNALLNMSIESLKHLDLESEDDNSPDGDKAVQLVNNASTYGSASQLNAGSLSTEQDPMSGSTTVNYNSSGASMVTLNNRMTMTEIAFLDPQTSGVPLDGSSVGGRFLRQICEDAKPIKTYTSYLRKENVNLYDECDAAVVMQLAQKEKKSKAECDFLLKAIRNLHVFQKNKDLLSMKDCNEKLFNSLRVEHFPAKKPIFNYGEFGYTYYIVLSGEADLLIPAPVHVPEKKEELQQSNKSAANETTSNATTSEPAKKKKGMNLNSKWTVLKKSFVPDQEDMEYQMAEQRADQEAAAAMGVIVEDETHEEFLKRQYPHMNLIKTFKAGEAFGEIALMTKQRRTGTIVCRKETNVMTLNKESFDMIMGSYSENMLQRKLNFLRTYGFFRSMPDSKLMSLLNFMKIVHYRNKNLVYTEGDPSRFLYFIREGEVQISQVCTIEDPVDRQKKLESKEEAHHEINAVRQRKAKRSKTKRIPMIIKSDFSYFGEEEILKHVDKRKQQAICSSETAEIFLLKKDILYNYTRSYSVVEKLKEEFKVKGEWNQKRQEDILNTRHSTNLGFENNNNTKINVIGTNGQQQYNNYATSKHNSNRKPALSPSILTKENQCPSTGKETSPFSLGFTSSLKLNSLNGNTNNATATLKQRPSLLESSKMLGTELSFDSIGLKQQRPSLMMLSRTENTNSSLLNNESTTGCKEERFEAPSSSGRIKLTPETKVVLKLNSNSVKKRLLFQEENSTTTPSASGTAGTAVAASSSWKYPSTLTEEETYIENKLQKNQRRKTEGLQKTEKELRQAALMHFGNLSYHAFVSQVGQNVEHKAQVLKQLQSNSSQWPSTMNGLTDLYEEFGLKKKTTQIRGSAASIFQGVNMLGTQTPLAKKEVAQRAHSGVTGREFQQELLKQQKMQVKTLFKKKVFSFSSSTNDDSKIETRSLVPIAAAAAAITTNSVKSITHNTFFSQQTISLPADDSRTETRSSLVGFNRVKSLTRDTFFSSNSNNTESDRMKTLDDRSILLDNMQQSLPTSQRSRFSISEASSGTENKPPTKPSSLAYIDLDILEEVPESNSPVKNRRYFDQKERGKLTHIQTNGQQQLNQMVPSQHYQSDKLSFVSPQPHSTKQYTSNNSSSSSSCQNSIAQQETYTYSSGKGFFNRSQNNLRKKSEAKKTLTRNASSSSSSSSQSLNTKENNSFRISSMKSVSAFTQTNKMATPLASPPIITSQFFFPIKHQE